MARERHSGLTNASGNLTFYGGTLPEYRFAPVLLDGSLLEAVETIDIGAISSGLIETNHRIASPIASHLRVETGTVSMSGSTFTILNSDSVFSGTGVREVKVFEGTGDLEFNPAAIAALGITDVTITYDYDSTPVTSRLAAEMCEAIRNGGSGGSSSIRKYVAEAAGSLTGPGSVWNDEGYIKHITDLSDIRQARNAGYIITNYTGGQDVDVYLEGNVPKPSGYGALPRGYDLYFSETGHLTWDGDGSHPLASGDWQKVAGVSFDTSTIELSIIGSWMIQLN